AQSIVNINAALAQAANAPFPQNLAQMAIVAAETANIVSSIQSVTLGFKKGGYTGDGPLDGVAGVVHRREFVMNAAATAANRPVLEAMNSGKGLAVRSQNKVELHFHGVTEEPRVEESNDGERIDVFLRENQNQNVMGGHLDGAMRQRFGQKTRLTRR
ncbi:MAG: hypothetical protein KDB18_12445, partial [Salinibacterium sp.]|nr:hypothetical protein [Salinibacterium sp.]